MPIKDAILKLLKKNPDGLSAWAISCLTGKPAYTIQKYLNELHRERAIASVDNPDDNGHQIIWKVL